VRRKPLAIGDEHVRCEQVDPLTDVIALDGELTEGRLDRLQTCLVDSLRAGVAFVVIDLATATPGVPGLGHVLTDAAGSLARRNGGLAVTGSCACAPSRADLDVFATRAEALAGVRGRLTPRRSIHATPIRTQATAA
jgi:hypothetical protein